MMDATDPLLPALPETPDTPRYDTHASIVLRAAIEAAPGETVTLDALIAGLRGRAYGLAYVLLSAGNLIPGPPGVGGIFGIPLLFIAVQGVAGYPVPVLPRALGRMGVRKTTALGALDRMAPLLTAIEARFGPRLERFARGGWERFAAGIVCVLALAMSLPVPFTNFPPAAAALVIALGLVERDGLAVLAGLVFAVFAVAVVGFAVSIYITSIVLFFDAIVI
ncbi:MAG: exopolysaccharide biosynthesis protein [Alphaproteobacteria bacterium]|nr:exopolysaccharide biosynthesis protein [Alphaproteobacteria bacterium]